MSDNTVTVQFDAVTDNFDSAIRRINQTLEDTLYKPALHSPIGQMFQTLERSSDSAIAGIIKGTENWHQATTRIIQDLEIKFAQLAANRLLNDTIASALGLTREETNNAAKVSSAQERNAMISQSDASAANASAGSHAAQLIKQIGSDAATAYSGVYANLSPVLGPAAAIPAGIAYASVAAMEGLVSLDVGAWNLGSDMVAQLHQGEMVVPQTFAQGLRDGAGLGSGDNYTININAVDTQTGAQFLKNNAAAIASALSSQGRNFNRNVPTWKG